MNVDRIIKEIAHYAKSDATLWLAYSGGIDSTVLLHLLSHQTQLFKTLSLKAIHINHQLSPHAEKWQSHCQQTAAAFGVPIHCEAVNVERRGRGVEQAARQLRYAVFSRVADEGDLVLLAHHQDDVVETLLFRLARGAGLKGLTSIKKQRALGAATLLRPLLGHTKAEILQYATQHQLSWVDDESNQEDRFDRNYIRNQILPMFKTRWPHFNAGVAQTVTWLSESQRLLEHYADEDLAKCQLRKERLGESICLDAFAELVHERRKLILRRWCDRNGCELPDAPLWERIQSFIDARPDASPLLTWGKWAFRRYQQRIYLTPQLPALVDYCGQWDGGQPLTLPDGSILALLTGGNAMGFTVRYRQSGDRCKPVKRHRSQSLKKLLQEYTLEPWLRDRVPVLLVDESIVAVGDLFVCESEGLSLRWHYDVGQD